MRQFRVWNLAAVMLLTGASPLSAQVGLSSGVAQIALIARLQPRGSIEGVSAQRETIGSGRVREATVTISVAANTGYRLVVRSLAASPSRIWVRSVTGAFEELKAGSAVIVATGDHQAGQWDREVVYRIEPVSDEKPLAPLPVRYELAISPTL